MFSSKLVLAIFMALAISQSIVESCNSNTGTSSSCGNSTFGTACNDNCLCSSSLLLTCIENKCNCNTKSRGSFGQTCNTDCPCTAKLGLSCVSGVCKCNSTTSLWDNGICVNIDTTTTACDALIGTTSASPIVTDASQSGWKCNSTLYTFYGPSYVESTSIGKYVLSKTTSSAIDAFNKCSLPAARIQPSTGDVVETFLKKYTGSAIWIGMAKNNKDSKYYYDNQTVSALKIEDTTKGCVKVTPGASITYTSDDCTALFNYMCVY